MIVDRLVIIMSLFVPRGSENHGLLRMNIGTKSVWDLIIIFGFIYFIFCVSFCCSPFGNIFNPLFSGTRALGPLPFLVWDLSWLLLKSWEI